MSPARNKGGSDKRRLIIEAAVKVFAEKGFFGARVSEIAEAAGVADGTIYLYFRSKDDLLISLFEEKMDDILGGLGRMLAEHARPEDKLRRYIVEHLRLVAEQPELMQVLTVELRQSARFIKEYTPKAFGRLLDTVGNILEEGQQAGVFHPSLDIAVFRRALFGAIDEISLEWVLRSRSGGAEPERQDSPPVLSDPVKVGNEIADFILRGLKVNFVS